MKKIEIKPIAKHVYQDDYFIFINANELKPVKIYINQNKEKKEKILLCPTIIFRLNKEISGDSFFCSAKKPPFIPPFIVKSKQGKIEITDQEKFYKRVTFYFIPDNFKEIKLPEVEPDSLFKNKIALNRENKVLLNIKIDRLLYTMYLENKDELLYLGKKIFLNKNNFNSTAKFCINCKSLFYPSKYNNIITNDRKNYIPFFDMVDKDNFSNEQILNFLKKVDFAKEYTWGLKKLLTLIRSAEPGDEVKIITNLYETDKDFAEFLVTRIFSLNLLPIMYRKDIQYVLNSFDNRTLAYAFKNSNYYIKEKLFKNVSKNRGKLIKDEWSYAGIKEVKPDDFLNASFKVESFFRNFLEKRQGRSLRIKTGKIESLQAILNTEIGDRGDFDFKHKGPVLEIENEKMYKLYNFKQREIGCYSFYQSIHYSFKPFLEIISADENGFYILLHISVLVLHIIELNVNSKEFKTHYFEFLKKGSILYLTSLRESVNYFIAGFNMDQHPFELNIRALKTEEV